MIKRHYLSALHRSGSLEIDKADAEPERGVAHLLQGTSRKPNVLLPHPQSKTHANNLIVLRGRPQWLGCCEKLIIIVPVDAPPISLATVLYCNSC
jgi:hypothetical protein